MDLEEDIYSRIQNAGYFSQEQINRIMAGAVSGITALHFFDLVHGDLKSNNIAYMESEEPHIKIVDQFGFGDLYFRTRSSVISYNIK